MAIWPILQGTLTVKPFSPSRCYQINCISLSNNLIYPSFHVLIYLVTVRFVTFI